MKARISGAREQTGNRQLDGIQRQASEAARLLNAMPFASGQESELLTFEAGEVKRVSHRLGRLPQGFWPTYALGAAPALYFPVAPDTLVATLKSDNAGTYRGWWY